MFSVHMDVLDRALSGTSAEMNGQFFCSRQKLSTCIHARNAAVPWQIFCSRQNLSTHIHVCTVFLFQTKTKYRHPWRQWQRAAMFTTTWMYSLERSMDARAEDERSVFLFQTKTKYVHPCAQCRGAMAGNQFQTFPKYRHLGFGIQRHSTCAIHGFASRYWQRAAMFY